MSSSLSNNKFVVSTIIIGLIVAGMTFGNLPGLMTSTSVRFSHSRADCCIQLS